MRRTFSKPSLEIGSLVESTANSEALILHWDNVMLLDDVNHEPIEQNEMMRMAKGKSKKQLKKAKAAKAAALAAKIAAKAAEELIELSPEDSFFQSGAFKQTGSQKMGMKTFFKPFFGQTVEVMGVISKPKGSFAAGVKFMHIAAIEGKFGLPAGAHTHIAMQDVSDKEAFHAIEFGDKVKISGKVTMHPHKKFGKDFGLEDVKIVKVVSWKA